MDYEVNKLNFDEYGRPNGIVAINKPVGMTSHDVVAKVRRILSTPRVGHAGALDPFADGVLIILVGKATKDSDKFLLQDKSYLANILLGIKTTSADPEGEILEVKAGIEVPENINDILQSFTPEYEQYVPVFSSVKYQGEKLRILARTSESWEVVEQDGKKVLNFVRKGKPHSIDIPKHLCKIYNISQISKSSIDISGSRFAANNQTALETNLQFNNLIVDVTCSKGTYIRTLAEDIAARFSPPAPAMLWNLTRTRIGDISLEQTITIEQVEELKPQN